MCFMILIVSTCISLMLTGTLPHSFLLVYSLVCWTWDETLHVLWSIHAMMSESSINSFGQAIIPTGYLITDTTCYTVRLYMLMTCTLFLPFIWLFRIYTTLCRYLVRVRIFLGLCNGRHLPVGFQSICSCPGHLQF